jgi:hypothetical protein
MGISTDESAEVVRDHDKTYPSTTMTEADSL